MSVNISKPALNLREELASLRAKTAPPRATFWAVGDSAATTFALARGWKSTDVFVGGAIMRPGADNDHTRNLDGFAWSITFVVAPAAVNIAMQAERIR